VGLISLVIYILYQVATVGGVVGKVLCTILAIIGVTMAVVLFPKFIAWISYILFVVKYYIVVGAMALKAGIQAAIGWAIANWQMLLIIVVIVAILAAIIWLADGFAQACGWIVGIITAAISVVWNLFVTLVATIIEAAILPLLDSWDNFANFFGNLFNDPIAAIIHLFEGLADTVLKILQTIAKGIDAIFGSNLQGAVQGWRDGLASKADELAEKYGNGSYEEKSNLSDQFHDMVGNIQGAVMWDTGDAFNTGYNWGEAGGNAIMSGIENLGNMFNVGDMSQEEMFPENVAMDGGGLNVDDFSGIGDSLGNIDDNTKKTAKNTSDDMDLLDEDLSYLRKIAEMEWRNEFTTAEIKVSMTNNNQVNADRDLDGIVDYLADTLRSEMTAVAHGVHY
jgi:hypothetical protein